MTLPEGGPLSWHEMMWRSEQLENKRNQERILILEAALRQCLRLIETALLQATLIGVEDTEDDDEAEL